MDNGPRTTDPLPTFDVDLAGFLDGIAPAITVFCRNDRVVFANQSALRLLTRPASAIFGAPVSGVFRKCLDRARQRGAGEKYFVFEQFVDGRWYMAQTCPLRGSRDPAAGPMFVLSLTDVTDRRTTEIELLENVAGLEEATRIARMGTFRIDNRTGKAVWSPHMYILHGLTPDRWKPGIENYPELIVPEDRARVRHEIERGGPDGSVGGIEYRIVQPNGDVRWVYLDRRMLFDPDGAPYGTFGTIQDITEAKHREHELRQLVVRNAILYQALESSPIGVIVASMEGGRPSIIYVNDAFERLTGYDAAGLAAVGLGALAAPAAEHAFADLIVALSAAGEFEADIDCRRRDGSIFPAQVEVAPVLDRDAPAAPAQNFVINVRDLTEERRRAAALLQTQKMEALGQMSGGVAHEINNMLQPVIALSDLGLSMLGTDNDKVREYLEVIAGSGRKARDIVRQVLTYARRDTAALMRQNIVPLVFDAISLVQKGLPSGINLKVGIDMTALFADVNATQVTQVVVNLVRNGSDAMSGQGVVDVGLGLIEVDDRDAASIGISPGHWAALTVTDAGCGMSEETRKRIFEPFFTTKPVGRGTGLGLSVVHSIANIWGGAIAIDSQVDAATRVVIYIPVKPSPEEDGSSPTVATHRGDPPWRPTGRRTNGAHIAG